MCHGKLLDTWWPLQDAPAQVLDGGEGPAALGPPGRSCLGIGVHDRSGTLAVLALQRLLSGDITGYASQSNADFVLILKLLHWTGDNVTLTRKLFIESGLYRDEKTERKTGQTTYLDMTIRNAMKKRRNPPQKR